MALPLIAAGAASLIGGWLKNRGQQKAQKAADKAAAQNWQANDFSTLLSQFGAGTSLGDFLRGQGPGAQNPVMRSTGSTTSRFNQTTNPFVTGEYKGLEGLLKETATGRLKAGKDIGRREAAAARNVNRVFRNIGTSAENTAAGMGALGAPGAGAVSSALEGARGSAMADALGAVPGQARAEEGEDLSRIQSIIDMFGKGSQSQGTSTSQSDSSQFQEGGLNPADLFRLNYELGHRAARPTPGGTAGQGTAFAGDALSGLSGILAGMNFGGKKPPVPAGPNPFLSGGGYGGGFGSFGGQRSLWGN